MIAETMKSRSKPSSIEEIQALSWEVPTIPDELRFVYALRLPAHWVPLLKSLANVDRQPPVTSLYVSLRALAPEILYIYPNSFSDDPDRRPLYWLIADADGATLNEERFLWAILGWLNTCYESSEVRAIAQQLNASDLHWERVDLQEASLDVVSGALPALIARWLLKHNFEFGLSNREGQQASYQVRLAPSSYRAEADLVTWPAVTLAEQPDYSYSYFLKFHMGSLPSSLTPRILCQPGIRRWVSRPLARIGKNGKTHIDLAWGREKGVFMARTSASWLTQQPAEMSLIRLGLRRYSDLIWSGRLPQVLASLSPNELIPEPIDLLSHPMDSSPNILVVYDVTMSETHRVGAGIEEADRWEVFSQLTEALPQQLLPTPVWRKTSTFVRRQTSFDASQERKKVPTDIRLRGIERMPTPALIEICSSDADRWEQLVLEEMGVSAVNLVDGRIEVPTSSGTPSTLTISKQSFPIELSAELPPEAMESDTDQQGLTLQRVRQIEKAIPRVETNTGVLLEMVNYQELYSTERARRRDPKLAARWGLARTGRKLQCVQPESTNSGNYEMRVRNGIRDLLRQMDYRWNPLYVGFKGTSFPQDLDLFGLWQMRLKSRRRGETAVTIPLAIHTPAHRYESYVCLPDENGPTWYPYSQAQLKIPDFIGGYSSKEGIRSFFTRALQDRGMSGASLLLLSEQNLRDVFPEVRDENLLMADSTLKQALGIDNLPCRIARLRFSGYGSVPLVCPTHSFGRFSGMFHDDRFPHLFYSIQERPLSAKRPTGVRQRDSQTDLSWNPSTVEVLLLNLQQEDQAEEWAWIVHRLRQESFHTDRSTLIPEPLYSLFKMAEYAPRIADDEE